MEKVEQVLLSVSLMQIVIDTLKANDTQETNEEKKKKKMRRGERR